MSEVRIVLETVLKRVEGLAKDIRSTIEFYEQIAEQSMVNELFKKPQSRGTAAYHPNGTTTAEPVKQSPPPKPVTRVPKGKLLTARQVGELTGVSYGTIWSMTRSGKIPSVRVGKQNRYRPDDVEAFIASGGSAP